MQRAAYTGIDPGAAWSYFGHRGGGAPPETVSRFLFSFFFSFVVLNEALSPPLTGYERVTAVRGQLPQNIEPRADIPHVPE